MANTIVKKLKYVSPECLKRQSEYSDLVREMLSVRFSHTPKAFVHTYGCQGNVSDSEKLKGMLIAMGFELTEKSDDADLVLYNTCAVREHAQDRVFGNVGALKNNKRRNRDMIIALCGCMMQQQHVADKIRDSYSFVDLVFGTHVQHRLPEFIYRVLRGERVFEIPDSAGVIAEGLPEKRDGSIKAWLPIMYGCNNFCSYCVVPYVRGRERSREKDIVVNEARHLVSMGYKEITLLGQNVNSYGKDLDEPVSFSELLREINDIPGDFLIRFMTSHPKDCTEELIDTIASCEKVSRHLHLPFQSGNNEVLRQMNRKYTREDYLRLISYAKEKIPDLSLTSDVIVGFPGETYEQFKDTLSLVEQVEFTSLFTFIFSPRKGTVAYDMPDPVSREEKNKWFKQLTDTQARIAAKRTSSMLGKVYKVLAEGKSKNEGFITGRTDSNVIIEFKAPDSVVGNFVNVRVIDALTWIVKGEII